MKKTPPTTATLSLAPRLLEEDCASHAHHRDNAGQGRDMALERHHHGLGSLDVSGG